MTMQMKLEQLVRCGTIILLMAAITGCAGTGIPRKTGLYAVEDGHLQRLDGHREWEMETWEDRSNLSPGVSFVVRHPQLINSGDKLDQILYLHRVAWVRSEINREGDILPVEGSQWTDAGIPDLKVPVRLVPDTRNGEVVRVVPQSRLESGLYTLRLQSPTAHLNARVGVRWPMAEKRAYSAANCVDRYLNDNVRYRLCANQERALASRWLKVHLVDPELRHSPGQNQLIVSGVVVNTSSHARKVPALEAQLRSDEGEILTTWEFDATATELKPGASARFRSELPNPPPGANKVHVTFASLD